LKKLRSARDLRALHPLWTAAVDAGLVDIRGAKAVIGDAARVWEDGGDAGARLEGWARLLTALLRYRIESEATDRRVFHPIPFEVLLPAEALAWYESGGEPTPALSAALVLLNSSLGEEFDDEDICDFLVDSVAESTRDWAVAGVIEHVAGEFVEEQDDRDGDVHRAPAPLLGTPDIGRSSGSDPGANAEQAAREDLAAMSAVLRRSPLVRLSALGAYGLRRLLIAHGWQAPVLGACVDTPPDELLDQLYEFAPGDVGSEAEMWLAARADRWEAALGEVLDSARVKDRRRGAARRLVVEEVLSAVGTRVGPLLDTYAADPWLAALIAQVRCDLGLGPVPTLARQLWATVDALSQFLDYPAQDRTDAVADSDLEELLAREGGIAATATLDHPHTRKVLLMAQDALTDRELAAELLAGIGGRRARRAAKHHLRPTPKTGRRRH
jgi:hypothetical protein